MSEKSRQWKSSFNRCCPLCWLVLDTRPTDGVRGHAGRSDWEWTDLLYWWHKRWWEDLELVSFMPQHFLSNWVLSACWNCYYWFPLKHCLSLFTYLFFFFFFFIGGTHSEPFVTTTRGSVLVREHTVKQQPGANFGHWEIIMLLSVTEIVLRLYS